MLLNTVLLEVAAAPAAWESNVLLFLFLGLMMFFMWFSGRKQRKRTKMMAERKKNLKIGQRVMMDSGIYGAIDTINDDIVTVTIGPDKVRLVFNKASISVIEYDDDATDLSREQANAKK